MNDSLLMRRRQHVGDLRGDVQGGAQRQARAGGRRRAQPGGQGLAGQVLHDQIGGAVGGVAKVRDLDQAGVLDLGHGPRFVEEAASVRVRLVRVP